MKDNVKEFIEGTFEEIKNWLSDNYSSSDGYKGCVYGYSKDDTIGVLKIKFLEDTVRPIYEVCKILDERFSPLYDDEFKIYDCYNISFFNELSIIDAQRCDYILVNIYVDELEELLNEN